MKKALRTGAVGRALRSLLWLTSLCLIVAVASTVYAQLSWQTPRPIPAYEDRRPPVMVADKNRTVHAFNSQLLPEFGRVAVFYRTWGPDSGWSGARDVIVHSDDRGITILGTHIDVSGYVHLVYFYGTSVQGVVYHTSAPLSEASNARSWAEPAVIAEQAGPLACGSLTSNGENSLHLIYCGRQFGIGLYTVQSDDLGQTWSTPSALQYVHDEDRLPTAVRSITAPSGAIHAVWSIVSEQGVGEEIYYSQLPGAQRDWRVPVRLANREGDDYSANWPSITWHDDQLIVIYQDSFPATRFMRQSLDDGDTWSDPVRPFVHVGEYEQAVLLHDSSDTLHMILGNRTSQPEIHGMWHSVWLDGTWSELEPIVSGPRTEQFDPSAPQAVVVQGNVLLVSWWNNVPDADVAWYSYTRLAAPAEPVVPVPLAAPTQTVQSTPTPEPAATATATPAPVLSEPGSGPVATSGTPSPGSSILLGIAPVLLLVLVILFVSSRRTHSRL